PSPARLGVPARAGPRGEGYCFTALFLVLVLGGSAAGQEKAILQERNPARIVFLTFSADGKVLATGEQDGKVRLWDVTRDKQRAVLQGHTAEIAALQFSHDGNSLTTQGQDRRIRSWDLALGKELASV